MKTYTKEEITKPTWKEEFEKMYPDHIKIFSPWPNIMAQTELDVIEANYQLKRQELFYSIKNWINDAYNKGMIDGAKYVNLEFESWFKEAMNHFWIKEG